jgi:predicted nucleic acid-binding protein
VIVVDANAWIYSLVDDGETGSECRGVLDADPAWIAPAHMPTEALRTLRRLEVAGTIASAGVADIADEIATVEVTYLGPDPESLLAQWRLRHNLSAYDAPYVIIAQRFDAPMITLDGRLARAASVLGVEVRLVEVR